MSEYFPLAGRVKAVPRTGETPGQRPVVCLEVEVEEWDLDTTVLTTTLYRLACLRSWMWEAARELKGGSEVVAVGFRHEVPWRALDGGPSEPADVVCVVLEERMPEIEEELQILGLEETSDPAQLDEILELLEPGVVL